MASLSKNWKSRQGSTALLIVFAVFVVLLISALFYTPTVSIDRELPPAPPQPVSIVFVGDIMFDRGVRRSIEKNFAGDYGALYANAGYLKAADIAFANLEGPVATGGRNVGSRFSFRMDPVGLAAMKDAGFDVVSFANNHVGDYTLDALTETLDRLAEYGILAAGAGKHKAAASAVQVIEVRGMKIGFLAASDVGPNWAEASDARAGILLAEDPTLAQIIADAKATTDVLVMSFHWGNEYSPANSRQEKLARATIDAGADIVVGHHPHVMEKVEYYNGKPIFYSLGNFIFDQYFSAHTMRGMVATVSIDPETKELAAEMAVSPLNSFYIPQPLIPFDESMLVTKTFLP